MGKVREGFPNRRSHFVSIVVVVPLYGCNQVIFYFLQRNEKNEKSFSFFRAKFFAIKERETSAEPAARTLKIGITFLKKLIMLGN